LVMMEPIMMRPSGNTQLGASLMFVHPAGVAIEVQVFAAGL